MEKRIIEVDEYQHGLIINSLNDKRNELALAGKDTEFVDDTLIEVMDAPHKEGKTKTKRKGAINLWQCIETLAKTVKETETSEHEQTEYGKQE